MRWLWPVLLAALVGGCATAFPESVMRTVDTRISADESTSVSAFNSEVPQWMAQSGTAQYVTNLAHHTYDFPSDAALAGVAAVGRQFAKPTWGSEICCFTGINAGYGAQYDPTITGALAMTSIIHRDLAVANDSAFHWWTALSKVMGCSPGSNASAPPK